MSIATLKKKSRNSSRGNAGISHNVPFSLNSSRRLEGHHQEPQIQTPFRGSAPRGTGIPDDVRVINKSQRVNYDPIDAQRPSIKSNQALISKMMWSKPIVKLCGSRNYDTYYKTIQDKCDKIEGTAVLSTCVSSKNGILYKTSCSENIGFTKDLTLPSYDIYQSTTLLKNNCITSTNIHLPVAGNGLPCAKSC
jgi:hypothetical protein